mgnify:CR=1 FL=1
MPGLIGILTRPWVVAAGGAVTAYVLFRKTRDQREKLQDAKLELLEQQRTIDRLRAELGRARHQSKDEGQRSYY